MPESLDEAAVRERLPHTWHAFFARFGRLTPVQRVAVAPIANGESVLVTAPTATGKTEAMMAPLAERILVGRQPDEGPSLDVLVISPTRALCNDLHRRLEGPLRRCSIALDRKTGDSPEFNDDKPPTVLITTPESLDSMLSRRPKALRTVRAVVLDELHLVARSARGDQLLCLLERLERLTPALQRVAASATVPDADMLRRTFLSDEAVHAADPGQAQRNIAAITDEAGTIEEAVSAISSLYEGEATRRRHKVLVFANSRAQVEGLSARLAERTELRGRVFAHHGSLGRGERLRVEKAFLGAPSAICVATMTLELGIDIGDVDRVVLVAPPPDVASLLQRVGRSNRKQNTTHVLCLHDGPFERDRFEHLLDCARNGELFTESVALRPTAIAQQAISLMFQNPRGWVSAEALFARLPRAATELYSQRDVESVLDGLAENDWVRRVQHGRYVAEQRAHRAYEYGRMHSLIVDSPEIEVVDELTGRVVGRVRFGMRDREKIASGADVNLALGGRAHEVTRMRDERVYVQSGEGVEKGQFIAREAPRYSYGLAQSFARWLGIERDTIPVRPRKKRNQITYYLSHFQGSVRAILLRWLLAARRYKPERSAGPFFIEVEHEPAEGATLGNAEAIRRTIDRRIADNLDALVRPLQPGPFLDCVPNSLKRKWVEASIDLDAVTADFARIRFTSG